MTLHLLNGREISFLRLAGPKAFDQSMMMLSRGSICLFSVTFEISLVMHEAEMSGATELLSMVILELLLRGFMAEKMRCTGKASHGSGGR